MKSYYLIGLIGAGIAVGQTINTSSGPVKGHPASVKTNVLKYLGIPYAQPPLGSLRFMPPVKYQGNETIEGGSIVSARQPLLHS